MVRPGGVYPKYGAVDRDYYGPEYDGFQDIFTSSFYANMEWGRFEMAHDVFDNYFSDFVDDKGLINMRGAETAQFGLTLSLIAKYFHYTQDRALLLKHREKSRPLPSSSPSFTTKAAASHPTPPATASSTDGTSPTPASLPSP